MNDKHALNILYGRTAISQSLNSSPGQKGCLHVGKHRPLQDQSSSESGLLPVQLLTKMSKLRGIRNVPHTPHLGVGIILRGKP